MAEIIRNTVQKTLDKQGRTRKWLNDRLEEEGIGLNQPALTNIICNSGRSIFTNELIVIAHILQVEITDLIEGEYKSKTE